MAELREPTLRVTMLPRDTNAHGTIFGGVILSHIDLAGAIAAVRREFTLPSDAIVGFIAPVYVGDVVSFYTIVPGRKTSVTIQVDRREAERSKEPRRQVKVTEAEVIYVAVDEAGSPTPLR